MKIAGATNDQGNIVIVKAPTSFRATILLTKWFGSYQCLTEQGGCGEQLWLQEHTTQDGSISYEFGHYSIDKDELCKGMTYDNPMPPEEYLKDLNKTDTAEATAIKSIRAFLDWQHRSTQENAEESAFSLFSFDEETPTAAAQAATQRTVTSAFSPPKTKLVRNITRAQTGSRTIETYSSYIKV